MRSGATGTRSRRPSEPPPATVGPGSVLDGVPMGQPALSLAAQLQRRAEAAGVAPEASHLPEDSVSELGAELFALVARAQAAGLNPELELRHAAGVFRDQVRDWEKKHS